MCPSEDKYSNSLPIKATSVKGEKQEYSLSMYFHLYANLGKTYSNNGSFSTIKQSHMTGEANICISFVIDNIFIVTVVLFTDTIKALRS